MRACIDALESRVLLAATASVVRDIIAGSDSSVSFNAQDGTEIALGNKFIFTAVDAQHGMEIWISDGTEAGTTLLKDINAGPDSSDPKNFTLGNGVVYFLAHDTTASPQPIQIWKTDGTTAGTTVVSTLPLGSDRGIAKDLAFTNGKLFYYESGNFALNTSLWVSDGNSAGTFITDLEHEPTFGDAAGGKLFFTMKDIDHPGDIGQAWVSDGTSNGTVQLTSFVNDESLGAYVNRNENTQIVNGLFIFQAPRRNNNLTTTEFLWKTNGTPNGTKTFGPGFFTTSPNDFTLSGGLLYFTAGVNSQTHDQIYSTNGTTVTQVTSLATSPGGIRDITDVNGTLYFTASISGGARQLFKLSGNSATPVPLAKDGGGTQPGNLANVNGTLYFNAFDANGKSTLFQTTGKIIAAVGGTPGADPAGLLNVGGKLFYQADDPSHGTELHIVGAPVVAPPPVKTSLKITASATTISINQSIKFTAKLTGATSDIFNWDFGDSSSHSGSDAVVTHKFTESSSKGKAFTVTLKVITSDNKKLTAKIDVVVKPPGKIKVSFQIPKAYSTVFPMPYSGVITNASKYKNLVVKIDWGNGDVETAAVSADGKFDSSHIFNTIGPKNVTVTAHDQDSKNAGKAEAFTLIAYDFAPDIKDAANKALGVLESLVGGTPKADKVELKVHKTKSTKALNLKTLATAAATQSIDVLFNDKVINTYKVKLVDDLTLPNSFINIATGAGNDTIIIDSDVKVHVRVDGGKGNDTIKGGSALDTLIGGAGTDLIDGENSPTVT